MTNWGIIGAGNIANRFCDSLVNIEGSRLYAISGRNEEKLKVFQQKHPCEKVYVGYEALLQDENVDAVYIALPHHMHAEWIIKAAEYQKDILVEKPAVISYEEALLVQKAVEENHVIFMEAMKNLFEPAFLEVLKLVRSGKIGKITSIDVQHGFLLTKEMYGNSYHTQPGVGGCLYDIGSYGLGFLSAFVKGNPVFHQTYANQYQGVDLYVQSLMTMGDADVNFTFAFDRKLEAYGTITGESGSIKVTPLHRPDTYTITVDGNSETVNIPYDHDDFFAEIAYFEQLRKDHDVHADVISVEDTVRIAGWSDMIRSQFAAYDENDLRILEQQEQIFRMDEMTSMDAYRIGSAVISLLPEYDRGVSCQIVRERDQAVIFQYISDDKKAGNLMYAEGKHQSIYAYGHSSAWVYTAKKANPALLDETRTDVLPSGGSFPIYDHEGKLIASVLISGLHEGKDHELIIRALEKVIGKQAPVFVKAIG